MTATVATRLAPIHETRQVGWTTDRQTGLPKPVETVFIVGHGQQLARRRQEARRVEVSTRTGRVIFLNLPSETNRQLAARLRADDVPAKSKRARKAAA